MNCSFCATQLPADAVYCAECGRPAMSRRARRGAATSSESARQMVSASERSASKKSDAPLGSRRRRKHDLAAAENAAAATSVAVAHEDPASESDPFDATPELDVPDAQGSSADSAAKRVAEESTFGADGSWRTSTSADIAENDNGDAAVSLDELPATPRDASVSSSEELGEDSRTLRLGEPLVLPASVDSSSSSSDAEIANDVNALVDEMPFDEDGPYDEVPDPAALDLERDLKDNGTDSLSDPIATEAWRDMPAPDVEQVVQPEQSAQSEQGTEQDAASEQEEREGTAESENSDETELLAPIAERSAQSDELEPDVSRADSDDSAAGVDAPAEADPVHLDEVNASVDGDDAPANEERAHDDSVEAAAPAAGLSPMAEIDYFAVAESATTANSDVSAETAQAMVSGVTADTDTASDDSPREVSESVLESVPESVLESDPATDASTPAETQAETHPDDESDIRADHDVPSELVQTEEEITASDDEPADIADGNELEREHENAVSGDMNETIAVVDEATADPEPLVEPAPLPRSAFEPDLSKVGRPEVQPEEGEPLRVKPVRPLGEETTFTTAERLRASAFAPVASERVDSHPAPPTITAADGEAASSSAQGGEHGTQPRSVVAADVEHSIANSRAADSAENPNPGAVATCTQCNNELTESDIFCGACGFVKHGVGPASRATSPAVDGLPQDKPATDNAGVDALGEADPPVQPQATKVELDPAPEVMDSTVREENVAGEEPGASDQSPAEAAVSAEAVAAAADNAGHEQSDSVSADSAGTPAFSVLAPPPKSNQRVELPISPPVPLAVMAADEADIEDTRIVERSVTGTRFVLQFSTGDSVIVTGTGLVGRNPIPEPSEKFDIVVPITDPSKSVSKTHLEFGQMSGVFWISDRYSGNGTIVREPGAEPKRCESGKRYRVVRGTRVEIGEQFFIVS